MAIFCVFYNSNYKAILENENNNEKKYIGNVQAKPRVDRETRDGRGWFSVDPRQ